ncbi:MAG: DEAD/DEAH box helicase [Sandaracinus sp.]
MTISERPLAAGDRVHHERFGLGTVVAVDAATAVVRFESGIQECRLGEFVLRSAPDESIARVSLADPNQAIVRAQAEAIQSVNQTWGVFAPSRIQLLPHQLWVCKKVLERWPTRWLVADDVGLGKTVEAGLVLWPLIARGAVKRLLVVCPASLTAQWQERMRQMFDIRMALFTPEADTKTSDFWNTHRFVVASLQTLRVMHTDRARGRRERLLAADSWDLVLVDEAHHLNVEEKGETLGYKLLSAMQDGGRITSMLFFTGTPHRGKRKGFLSLLSLLRPDLFDAKQPIEVQLPKLRQVMIRNNKQQVTDLRGTKLFQRPTVTVREFSYTPVESDFYELLTRFIVEGRAYAGALGNAGQSVSLVLTALQKLAASSVAAVRSAIRKRVERLEREGLDAGAARSATVPDVDDEDVDLDRRAAWEEDITQATFGFALVADEVPALRELLVAADAVKSESKLVLLMRLLGTELAERSVLLFTEYKATQALVVSALRRMYGTVSVTFINGDEELPGVVEDDGKPVVLRQQRAEAAAAFNAGRVRFLVSTEAAGEGIDLQESCHTLIHLDVPWNPMRLHQRNGRLYRYGQKHRVEVVTLRNPETVEARIWDLLSARMQEIELAFDEVMDDPEDLAQLVLGMTPPRDIERIFQRAIEEKPERLDRWFEAQTGSFAGKDAVATVREIFGNVARFDFQEVASQVPRVDLPDLERFMSRAMGLLGRRLVKNDAGSFSVALPEVWKAVPGLRLRYEGLTFDRYASDGQVVLSGGHRLVQKAVDWARALDANFATVGGLSEAVVVVRIQDRVTTTGAQVPSVVVAVLVDPDTREITQALTDWQLLLLLNGATAPKSPMAPDERTRLDLRRIEQSALEASTAMGLPFDLPFAETLLVLWPAEAEVGQ